MKKLFVLLAACSLFAVATVNAQTNAAPQATTPTAVTPQSDVAVPAIATDNAPANETSATATKSSCKKDKACCKDKSAKAEASKCGSSKAACCSKSKTEAKADTKSEDKSSVNQ